MAASDPNLYAFELIFKGLNDSKTPVSKSKIQSITEHAIKAQKYYKHVVMHIEGFIRKSSPKHKLPGIYVIDSILRIARRKGKGRDVFSTRFAKNLSTIFTFASKCVEEDKFKVFRCFKLWKEGNFFPNEVIDPIVARIASVESFENVGGAVNNDSEQHDTENDVSLIQAKSSPFRKNLSEEKPVPVPNLVVKTDSPKPVRSPEKVRFDKRLLDFDYSDDEDGDGQRSGGRKAKKKAAEEEEFFTMGKDGKPEFAIDKIMSGLRQSRTSQPVGSLQSAASPQPPTMEPIEDDNTNEMELSSPGPEDQPETSVVPAEPSVEKPIILRSCTVWVGHLPKGVTEGELKKAMGEYGAVSSLDHIPPRGCAYVAYEKRRHAESAIKNRRGFYKQFGDKVKISWGLGRGIKAGYKEWNWDVETGICEIKPSLLPAACRGLAEGCELVMESVPDSLKARFMDKDEQEPKSGTTTEGNGHTSGWETTATVGFSPLEAHINTWNALLQSQALTDAAPPVPAPVAPPPLPLAFDVLRPPAFPPFFSSSAGSSAPPGQKQNGLAIPTITGQSTSWKDPAAPKSSLFSQMKAADDFPDSFSNLLAENDPPTSINPLFLKPPPPLGAPHFPNQPPPLGPPILNPALFFPNLPNNNNSSNNNQFPGANNSNNNARMPFTGSQQNFSQNSPVRTGPPPLPIFMGLGVGNRQAAPSGGFSGMDLNNLTGGNRFPMGQRNMADRFVSDLKDGAANRFLGPDVRLPVSGMGNMGNPFGGATRNRPPFGQNDGPRLPVWNPPGSMGGPPSRMDDGDFGGGRDRRTSFSDDHRQHYQNNSSNRQNFHNNDNRQSFPTNGGNFNGNGRSFDGPDFARRSFQQQQRGSR